MPAHPSDDAEENQRARQRIGRRIQVVREDHNLRQDQVFLAIPLSRSYYQEIESGAANPSLNTLLRVARAIGVPLSEIIDG